MEQTHKIKIHFIDGTDKIVKTTSNCKQISLSMYIKRVLYFSKSDLAINVKSVSYIEGIEDEMSEM